MKLFTFFFINFVVSMISDIILNDIARGNIKFKSKIIDSLKPYFVNKSIIIASIYAGITICLTLGMLSLITKQIFGFYMPKKTMELVKYCFIAFIIGYIVDILIYKLNIFGESLQPYYKTSGAGLWGPLAFIFSIIISFGIQKYILPVL